MNEMNESPDEVRQQSGTGNGAKVADTIAQRADVAREEMSTVAGDTKQELRGFADEAKQQLRQRADEQGEHLGSAVREFGDDLQSMAAHADHPDGTAAQAVVKVGERATHMAERMQSRGVNGIMDDLSGFARQHPAQFVAGAAVAGFVVGRLVRNVDKAAIGEQMKGDHDDSSGQQMIDLTGEERDRQPPFGADPSLSGNSQTDPTRSNSVSPRGPSVAGIGGEEVGAW